MSNEQIKSLILIGVILAFMIIAITFLVIMLKKDKSKTKTKEKTDDTKNKKKKSLDDVKKESIYSFMDFDEIKDNMIIRKKSEQYVMVLQCRGINFDLMSEGEKLAVEEGFLQFLNTLRFSVQLYIQTRSLDLSTGIDEYKLRISEIQKKIDKLNIAIREAEKDGNAELADKLRYEERNQRNVLDYGNDIVNYIGRMSLNKNVLQQKTYVVVSFYAAELGRADLSKEEKLSLAFSELYTRVQTIMRALSTSGVTARVLNSEELAELLYVAYNRDDADLLSVEQALDAQYDTLYSTGKDVLEKREEYIQEQFKKEATELVSDAIIIQRCKQNIEEAKKNQKETALKMSLEILGQYKEQFLDEVYNQIVIELFNLAEIKYDKKYMDSENENTDDVTNDSEEIDDDIEKTEENKKIRKIRKRTPASKKKDVVTEE